jgi:hypothetical protein
MEYLEGDSIYQGVVIWDRSLRGRGEEGDLVIFPGIIVRLGVFFLTKRPDTSSDRNIRSDIGLTALRE